MRKLLLTRINVLLALVLTCLGFVGCERPLVMYGSPAPCEEKECLSVSVDAAGNVPEEDVQPVN